MAHAQHQYHASLMLERADDSIVAYAIPPEFTQGPVKSFTNFPRIVELAQPLIKEFKNAAGH
jgi:hypothetical protein